MTDAVNKDLLIAVMNQRQAELDKLIKLQSSQLETYRVHVETFKAKVESYEKQIANLEKRLAIQKEKADMQTERETNTQSMVDTFNKLKEGLLSQIDAYKIQNGLLLERIEELEANTTEVNNNPEE